MQFIYTSVRTVFHRHSVLRCVPGPKYNKNNDILQMHENCNSTVCINLNSLRTILSCHHVDFWPLPTAKLDGRPQYGTEEVEDSAFCEFNKLKYKTAGNLATKCGKDTN